MNLIGFSRLCLSAIFIVFSLSYHRMVLKVKDVLKGDKNALDCGYFIDRLMPALDDFQC